MAKRRQALAVGEYLLDSLNYWAYSRLSFLVAVGVLQSLVDDTPICLGHTYLQHFHSLVHPPGLGTSLAPYT